MKSKIYHVLVSRFAEKQIERLPKYIQEKLLIWIYEIESYGVLNMRKTPGYRDEALKGTRSGERSSRLSKAYRVIYEERDQGDLVVIGVLEVNKHDY